MQDSKIKPLHQFIGLLVVGGVALFFCSMPFLFVLGFALMVLALRKNTNISIRTYSYLSSGLMIIFGVTIIVITAIAVKSFSYAVPKEGFWLTPLNLISIIDIFRWCW